MNGHTEEAIVEIAEQWSNNFLDKITQPARQAVLDVCPVCSRAIVMIHGHAVCRSAICKERIIEGCCQD